MGGAAGLIGAGAGAAIGFSTGGPLGARKGAQIGATVGSILDALTGHSVRNDSTWVGTSYGTPIPRGWGQNRTKSPIFWALRNPVDGSYIFEHNSFKAKLKGQTQHYLASFAALGPQTSFTYADGTQVERPIVWDRIWAADKIIWQSPSAVPIAAWSSSEVYETGDSATRFGVTYSSITDANLNEDPSVTGSTFWSLAEDISATVTDPTFHPGPSESVFTQAVDSMMATHMGVAHTSAKRGQTYWTLSNFDLYFIGNAVPQNCTTEWHYATAPTDQEVFEDICGLCGLSAADVNLSGASVSLTGYTQEREMAGQDVLNPLLGAKAYDMAMIDGVIQVVQRGGASVVTIPDSDLGACFEKETPPDRVEVTILCDRLDLNNQFTVRYIDQNVNFRIAPATTTRNSYSSPNPITIETGLVMTPPEAAQMSGRIKDTQWLEAGREYGISLPGSYAYLCPTDVITFNYPPGVANRFRIVNYQENHGLVKLKCVRDETQILIRYEVGDDGAAAFPSTTITPPTKAVIASIPHDFNDQYASFPGFYIWANGAAGWLGTQVWYTFDPPGPGREWVNGPFIGSASAFGTAALALADASASGYEAVHSVSVKLSIAATMALASNTQTAINSGTAWCLLGSEIIGIVTVTQTSSNTWTIGPGLVRGLRGSPFTGHATTEQFAIASNVTQTNKCQVGPQYIGSTVYVQCLSSTMAPFEGNTQELSCVIAAPTPAWVASQPIPFQEVPSGVINSVNVTFGLTHPPRAATLQLYKTVSGVTNLMIPTTDYTLAGSTITTTAAPVTGSTLFASYSY